MIKKISRVIELGENIYLTAAVLFSIAISVAGVFFRYVLNDSLSWVEEVAGFIIVGVITIGASVAVRENSHVNVEILVQFIPSLTRICRLIAKVTALVVMSMLFVLSIQFVSSLIISGQKATALDWLSLGLPLLIMPIGYLIGSFRLVQSLIEDFK